MPRLGMVNSRGIAVLSVICDGKQWQWRYGREEGGKREGKDAWPLCGKVTSITASTKRKKFTFNTSQRGDGHTSRKRKDIRNIKSREPNSLGVLGILRHAKGDEQARQI